jgi:hypothetical protein
MKVRILVCLAAATMIIGANGCAPASPYLSGYRYAPEPALVDVMLKGNTSQKPPVSVLASVVGIRRTGATTAAPPAVEVRMRFENNGQVPISMDTGTLSLVTGTLIPLDAPEVHMQGPKVLQIAPGQPVTFSAFFPFPPTIVPHDPALNSLRLRWQIQIGDQVVPQTAYFERASPLYYEVD